MSSMAEHPEHLDAEGKRRQRPKPTSKFGWPRKGRRGLNNLAQR